MKFLQVFFFFVGFEDELVREFREVSIGSSQDKPSIIFFCRIGVFCVVVQDGDRERADKN